jgi:hypothetical protein
MENRKTRDEGLRAAATAFSIFHFLFSISPARF